MADRSLERSTQLVVRAVAVDALSRGVGATLPTSVDYSARLGVGVGTLQRALVAMSETGALATTSRGHLGRVIARIDVGRLWRTAGLRRVRCVLPPPGPLEVRGLAEGLAAELDRLSIPFMITHWMRAGRRLDSLRDGTHDLAVVSGGALQARVDAPELDGRRLGPGTYYAPRTMLVVTRAEASPPKSRRQMRVAIDHGSYDQSRLTLAEFPEGTRYTYVEVDFPRVPAAILAGRADIGVWHDMRPVIPLNLAGLNTAQLHEPKAVALLETMSTAVLVAGPHRPELHTVLNSIDPAVIPARQHHLLSLPEEDPELLDTQWGY